MKETARFLAWMVFCVSATLVVVLIALGVEKLIGLY